ncbi:unnamed protein product [Pleuronectes platessa]|uniref:Uncharacterized protein n=1 Tax=Pleuronectes platessa TaxID=8262 RepID=A0A9N7VBD9_PLEPL|nr:unnamed protein product [Pleuronectes platessa]
MHAHLAAHTGRLPGSAVGRVGFVPLRRAAVIAGEWLVRGLGKVDLAAVHRPISLGGARGGGVMALLRLTCFEYPAPLTPGEPGCESPSYPAQPHSGSSGSIGSLSLRRSSSIPPHC